MRTAAMVGSLLLALNSAAAEKTVPEAAVTFLGITAGADTTLSDVAKRLGVAKQWHTGDAANSESKLCYVVRATQPYIVVFASNSEMSAPKGQVSSIRIYGRGIPFRAKHRCSHLEVQESALSTPNGLRLGASKSEIEQALWRRPTSKHGSLHYDSCRKRYLDKSSPYSARWAGEKDCGFENPQRPYENDCTSVEIHLKSDAAVYLQLSRGQSIC
jgi:hypothetical protein